MCFKVKMPEVKLTGRDVVPERESQAPDSPHFGTDDFTEAARRRGKESLMIQKDGDTSNAYRPTNF